MKKIYLTYRIGIENQRKSLRLLIFGMNSLHNITISLNGIPRTRVLLALI